MSGLRRDQVFVAVEVQAVRRSVPHGRAPMPVAGGGRYDGLIKTLGGPAQAAVGFAIGFDRLVEVMSLKDSASQPKTRSALVWVTGGIVSDILARIS